MAEHEPRAALRFSRRHAEHDVFAVAERLDRLARAGIERLDVRAALAQRVEGELVVFGEACNRELCAALAEFRKRLGQRQADDREHGLALRNREVVGQIGPAHRGADHVLAVDQGAVAVKDD